MQTSTLRIDIHPRAAQREATASRVFRGAADAAQSNGGTGLQTGKEQPVMESEEREVEQLVYNDEIPDPEEETVPPRDDEAEALRKAAKRHRVPADEDVPNDCFSERML